MSKIQFFSKTYLLLFLAVSVLSNAKATRVLSNQTQQQLKLNIELKGNLILSISTTLGIAAVTRLGSSQATGKGPSSWSEYDPKVNRCDRS